MRVATKYDFKTGTKLYDSEGHEIIIQDKYDDGIWNARVWDGTRHVGDKVVFEGEAEFYRVKVGSKYGESDKTEQRIIEEMANTFGFNLREKSFKCIYCSRLYFYDYVGKPTTDRMIDHYTRYHQR